MSFIACEIIDKLATEEIANASNVSKFDVSVRELSAKFEVPQSRMEYPSDFEEPPEDYNPYDVFLDEAKSGSSGEFIKGGKIDNLTEMLNSDPAVQETGKLWTADNVKNIFDDYANADPNTRREIIKNLTDRLNADPKLQEIGEQWTHQDVKEVFFDDYNEKQAIKDFYKVFEA